MSSSDNDSGSEYKQGESFRKHITDKKADNNEKIDKTAKKKGKKQEKDQKTKTAKDWTDEETTLLIDMLEANPCLWDVYHADYVKRDIKEIAYTEISLALQSNNTLIKSKINGLRAQFGREMSKVKTTKSGQSTDELYTSNWVHYDKLSFLIPVIGSAKSRDTLKRKSLEEISVKDTESTPIPRKKTIAERKLDLLSKCTDAITSKAAPIKEASSAPKVSNFALYVEEKLSQLDKRSKRIAEKRISDILFEVEMSEEQEQRNSYQYQYQGQSAQQSFNPIQAAYNVQHNINNIQVEHNGKTYAEL